MKGSSDPTPQAPPPPHPSVNIHVRAMIMTCIRCSQTFSFYPGTLGLSKIFLIILSLDDPQGATQ